VLGGIQCCGVIARGSESVPGEPSFVLGGFPWVCRMIGTVLGLGFCGVGGLVVSRR
jgi:hypothetical protein